MKRKTLAALAIAAIASAAGAHEMFLKPGSAYIAPNSAITVELFNGTFDKSENPITRDRMADVSVTVGGKRTAQTPSQWTDTKVSSRLAIKVAGPGTYAIGLSSKPKVLTMTAKDFEEYLHHEGLDDVAAQRKHEKAGNASVTERYSKHVRAVVQVGNALTDDASLPLGYTTELLLLSNPAQLKEGGTLSFKALYKSKPLAGQLVYASREGFHAHDASGAHVNRIKARTGTDGTAKITIDQPGKWYLTMINMRKVNEAKVNYESNWSTVTFQVR